MIKKEPVKRKGEPGIIIDKLSKVMGNLDTIKIEKDIPIKKKRNKPLHDKSEKFIKFLSLLSIGDSFFIKVSNKDKDIISGKLRYYACRNNIKLKFRFTEENSKEGLRIYRIK